MPKPRSRAKAGRSIGGGPLPVVDCGGTWLKGARVDGRGTLGGRERRPTGAQRGVGTVTENLAALIRDLAGGRKVAAAGIAMPGSVDAARGIVHQSPNFPGVREFGLGPLLATKVGGKVVVENDAKAYAIGEMWKGAARPYRSFLCLTLGTGLGGAAILDGRLWRGVHNMAGELGHTPLHADGPPCTCGSRGCLEVYASARGLQRAFETAKADGKRTSIEAAEPTPEEMARAAREGDPAAREAWEALGRRLGAGIAGLLNAFDVEAVVVGGGLSTGWDLFGESARQQVGARAFRLVAEKALIVPAELGDDAGVIGMARLARARLEGRPL
ncbi:MAG: ROK family protein [Halobacteria archaeon]